MKLLVAGIGNIFFGDDAFGCEVARRLAGEPFDERVRVMDYGIRGLHLAYELVSGYDRAFVIDAVPRGGAPGTLYVIEPELEDPALRAAAGAPDAHRMDLQNVFAFLRTIGGDPAPLTIVGCEPARTDEGIGLSAAVLRALPPAVELLRRLVGEALAGTEVQPRRSIA